MLSVTIYKNNSDRRYLTKNLSSGHTVSAKITDACDILNPVLELEYFSALPNMNYVDIPSWNRKYFIDSMSVLEGGRCLIKCHVDVLSTYASQIKSSSAIVCRQEKVYNNYLNDEFYQSRQYKITTVQNFSRCPFSHNGSLVLAVTGSAHNI